MNFRELTRQPFLPDTVSNSYVQLWLLINI
jgi:hypothetical protein